MLAPDAGNFRESMSTIVTFGSPRGRLVKLTTGLTLFVCLGITAIGFINFSSFPQPVRWTIFLVPLLLIVGTAPFMVRGYTLTDHMLIIHRLGWSFHVDLTTLVSAEADPAAMNRSVRLCGNGGLFAFCGWFRNQKLGNYRAFSTDPTHSVVLRFPDRVIVVSPDQPDKFATEIMHLK
jgi:hypothetical protein